MNDTRNWKCFFGLHQWEVKEKIQRNSYEESWSQRPYKIQTIIRMQCIHCGKWESQIID
ncbi:hypothetical protein ACXEGP_002411 [Klebsiella quasipneumoniae]